MKSKRLVDDYFFRLIVESSPNGILVINKKGEIVLVNKHAEEIFGFNSEDLINIPVEKLIPQNYRNDHKKYRSAYTSNPENRPMGEDRNLFAMHKSGNEFPVEIGLSHINTESGIYILATVIDISERLKTDQALRESEKTLQAIIDNTSDAIMVYNKNGRIISFNRQAKEIFGMKKGFINKIDDIIPPEYEYTFSAKLNEAVNGTQLHDFEMEKIVPGGGRLSVSIGLVYMEMENGMFIETIRDISERVNLRNKIIDFEKAQIVSKMSEGIAHHMGTPLASMLLRIQMMKEDLSGIETGKGFQEKLDSVEKQIFYGQRVMQRLLKFASKPTGEVSPVNIGPLLNEISEILKPLCIKSGISIDIKLKKDIVVPGDSDMLELVLSDISMNAIDAMPQGGKLAIKVSADKKGNCIIQLKDTGTGIPKEILPNIFEPFYSTKPSGKGTGLGLSVAKRIIQDHGGSIKIKSTEGKGTEVRISLPVQLEDI